MLFINQAEKRAKNIQKIINKINMVAIRQPLNTECHL